MLLIIWCPVFWNADDLNFLWPSWHSMALLSCWHSRAGSTKISPDVQHWTPACPIPNLSAIWPRLPLWVLVQVRWSLGRLLSVREPWATLLKTRRLCLRGGWRPCLRGHCTFSHFGKSGSGNFLFSHLLFLEIFQHALCRLKSQMTWWFQHYYLTSGSSILFSVQI